MSPVIYKSDIANRDGPTNIWAGSEGQCGTRWPVVCRQDVAFLVSRSYSTRAPLASPSISHIRSYTPPKHQPRTHDRVTSLDGSHRVDRHHQLRSSKKRCSVILSISCRAVQRIIRIVALLGLPRPLANLANPRPTQSAWTRNRLFQFRLSQRPHGSTQKIA